MNTLNINEFDRPWYDKEHIRKAISHESIANVDATRNKFEKQSQNGSLQHEDICSPVCIKIYHGSSGAEPTRPSSAAEHSNGYVVHESPSTHHKHKSTLVPKQSIDYYPENGDDPNNQYRKSHTKRSIVDRKTLQLTPYQQLFLMFLYQNYDLVEDLHLRLPEHIIRLMPYLPQDQVVLKLIRADSSSRTKSNRQNLEKRFESKCALTSSPISPETSKSGNGRYVKRLNNGYRTYPNVPHCDTRTEDFIGYHQSRAKEMDRRKGDDQSMTVEDVMVNTDRGDRGDRGVKGDRMIKSRNIFGFLKSDRGSEVDNISLRTNVTESFNPGNYEHYEASQRWFQRRPNATRRDDPLRQYVQSVEARKRWSSPPMIDTI
ncbi:hypothetical protein AB6A40_005328 [Gnathostoma spinigerum]|uniref:Uncharacterized protein n=1 Tax=Gnathostoma spinigerum TaxID=75299 RepID=A0ABD6EMS2_9BILA